MKKTSDYKQICISGCCISLPEFLNGPILRPVLIQRGFGSDFTALRPHEYHLQGPCGYPLGSFVGREKRMPPTSSFRTLLPVVARGLVIRSPVKFLMPEL
jgi:hypothetical protein